MATETDTLIRKLIDKLGDGNPVTRRNAAAALRLHGPRALPAIPALAVLLDDEDAHVRREADRALRRLRTVAAGHLS